MTASAPAAAPTLSAADQAIVDQLHNLSSGKFDRTVGNKKDRTIIDAFYSGRDYAPLWLTDGKLNDRAKAVIAYLGHVDRDGLDPNDYPAPNFAAMSDPAELAEAELKLDMTVITYAHHAAVMSFASTKAASTSAGSGAVVVYRMSGLIRDQCTRPTAA